MSLSGKTLAIAVFLAYASHPSASAGTPEKRCDLLKIYADDWTTLRDSPATVDDIRALPVLTLRKQTLINKVMARLDKELKKDALSTAPRILDAYMVIDCHKPKGGLDTFVTEQYTLTQLSPWKSVPINKDFQKLFTIDNDFVARLSGTLKSK